jgi:hypothetical protein
MGELCVLHQTQLWEDAQQRSVSEGELAQALEKYAKPFAVNLKVHWGLPMALREIIGAVYVLPKLQVSREQLLMRLAAAHEQNEPVAAIDKLKRLAGIS